MNIEYEIIRDCELSRVPRKTIRPVTCLPLGIDKSNFIDVTTIGSAYRKFIDTKTGKEHDCEEYYKKYLERMK